MPSLSQDLAKASGSAIRAVMPQLRHRWVTDSAWLATNNVYRVDAVKRIKIQVMNNKPLIHKYMAEYVAASAVIHCCDGWSFLGHALEAEMAGDPDAARHLGYYAELRAAMSVLASEGIGVFNRQHVVVMEKGICKVVDGHNLGTHQFAWKSLETWAGSGTGRDAVLRSIKPGGVPLSDWLEQASIGSSFLATQWLRQWGLDLSHLTDDQDARNVASYRPTAFASSGPKPVDETIKSILQFWKMCDPEGTGGFPVLDRYLLCRALKASPHGSGRKQYERTVEQSLSGINPAEISGGWKAFLSFDNSMKTPKLIKDASGRAKVYHKDHSRQVLARATLLLRVAAGCSAGMLREAGEDFSIELEFWRSSLLVRRRLRPNPDTNVSPTDLWVDVEDASTCISKWLKNRGSAACHYGLWDKNARSASILATTERAFLWGIGL